MPLASGSALRDFLDRPEHVRGTGPIPRAAGIPSVGTTTRQEGTADMNHTGRLLAAAVSLAAGASLAVAACSAPGWAGGATRAVTACPPPAGPAPAHRTEEQAAVLNWLTKTNAMWTHNDF